MYEWSVNACVCVCPREGLDSQHYPPLVGTEEVLRYSQQASIICLLFLSLLCISGFIYWRHKNVLDHRPAYKTESTFLDNK